MSWYDGLLGRIDPSTAGGGQLAGLLNGLGAMGAGLVHAGQFRPVSQPGPSVADAFAAFGTGRQQGLLNAYQTGQMNQRQRKQALIAAAQSTRPDADLNDEERATRVALSKLPANVRALAGPDELPGLAIRQATDGVRAMTAEEMRAAGHPEGSQIYINDFTGAPTVLRQSKLMTPAEEAQQARVAAMGRAPSAPIILGPGQTAYDRAGRPIASGGADDQPLTPATAWNHVLRYADQAAAGTLDPNSPAGRRYIASQTLIEGEKPYDITKPDGSLERVWRPGVFPFTRLQAGGATPPPATGGTPPPAAGAAPGAAPSGVQIKPPPPLSESQGKANMFGQAMEEGHRIITQTGAPSMAAIVAWRNLPEGGINPMLSAKDQQYFNALRQFTAGVLRKETGAAFTPAELLDVQSRFFAMPGDGPEVAAQKARARTIAIEAMRAEVGGFRGQGAEPHPATGGPLSGAVPPPAPVRVRTPEEARRLPRGTPIILPDGTQGLVP